MRLQPALEDPGRVFRDELDSKDNRTQRMHHVTGTHPVKTGVQMAALSKLVCVHSCKPSHQEVSPGHTNLADKVSSHLATFQVS
ncbi:hypothetical protein C0Q70_14617 [Pomacea canaliculata]|uniref:Uncharacterized protein n=1 Tax=Pomacea canaliculata TaxID=400727 RepID=A0A2T7NSJ0_POMCA|nr:hypothetical protein C0Q70_14617 [Pomacea canaliculata]